MKRRAPLPCESTEPLREPRPFHPMAVAFIMLMASSIASSASFDDSERSIGFMGCASSLLLLYREDASQPVDGARGKMPVTRVVIGLPSLGGWTVPNENDALGGSGTGAGRPELQFAPVSDLSAPSGTAKLTVLAGEGSPSCARLLALGPDSGASVGGAKGGCGADTGVAPPDTLDGSSGNSASGWRSRRAMPLWDRWRKGGKPAEHAPPLSPSPPIGELAAGAGSQTGGTAGGRLAPLAASMPAGCCGSECA
mmetsp:Transcript_6409/g.19449  ORF Transcript_6409/g.19449 Transcript_6409/m.19449 type:complete len:253 (-) Transcript_6409:372-1130(-)